MQLYEADPSLPRCWPMALSARPPTRSWHRLLRMHLTQGDSVAAPARAGQRQLRTARSEDSTAGELPAIQQPPICTSEREAADAAPTASPDVIYLDPCSPRGKAQRSRSSSCCIIWKRRAPTKKSCCLPPCRKPARCHQAPHQRAPSCGIKPSYSISGKAVRYDCITPASIKL